MRNVLGIFLGMMMVITKNWFNFLLFKWIVSSMSKLHEDDRLKVNIVINKLMNEINGNKIIIQMA